MYYSTNRPLIVIMYVVFCACVLAFISGTKGGDNLNLAQGIYRTVIENTVTYFYFDDENEKKEDTAILYGDVNINVLENRLRKRIKNTRLIVTDVKQKEIRAHMSYEDFLKNATIISVKERN